MHPSDKKKHNGKRYDKQFKVAAAKLVTEQNYTPKQAAASLGVHTNTLHRIARDRVGDWRQVDK